MVSPSFQSCMNPRSSLHKIGVKACLLSLGWLGWLLMIRLQIYLRLPPPWIPLGGGGGGGGCLVSGQPINCLVKQCPSLDKNPKWSLKRRNTQNCCITTASLHVIIELASHPLSPLAHGDHQSK